MACRLVGAKPSSKPMLEYCWEAIDHLVPLSMVGPFLPSHNILWSMDWPHTATINSNHNSCDFYSYHISVSADSRFAPSQWETPLLCNGVSHWLGTSLESDMFICFWHPETYTCTFYSAVPLSIFSQILTIGAQYTSPMRAIYYMLDFHIDIYTIYTQIVESP